VVDDELVLAGEEVLQRQRGAVRAVELVLLVDLDHGQRAHLGGEGILDAGGLLFLLEELLPGGEPFLAGDDLGSMSVSTGVTVWGWNGELGHALEVMVNWVVAIAGGIWSCEL